MLSQAEMGEGDRRIILPRLPGWLGLHKPEGFGACTGFAIANWMHDFFRWRCLVCGATSPLVLVKRNAGGIPQSSLALVEADGVVDLRRMGLHPLLTMEPLADCQSSGVTGVGSSDEAAEEACRDAWLRDWFMNKEVRSEGDRERLALVKQSDGRSDNTSLSVEVTMDGLRDTRKGIFSKVRASNDARPDRDDSPRRTSALQNTGLMAEVGLEDVGEVVNSVEMIDDGMFDEVLNSYVGTRL